MQISLSGNQVDIGERLRNHVEENVLNSVNKYFPDTIRQNRFNKQTFRFQLFQKMNMIAFSVSTFNIIFTISIKCVQIIFSQTTFEHCFTGKRKYIFFACKDSWVREKVWKNVSFFRLKFWAFRIKAAKLPRQNAQSFITSRKEWSYKW